MLFGAKKYRAELAQLTEELGVGDRVKFLGQRKDISRLLSAMDILVIPSTEPEPLSLALLEGMASGKAVVAAAHGGPTEIIEDGVDGVLYPPRDFVALSSKLLSLISNSDLARKLGEKARRKIENSFNLKDYNKKIMALIDEIKIF